jgi:DNA-binding XRE family transcriptional regulator
MSSKRTKAAIGLRISWCRGEVKPSMTQDELAIKIGVSRAKMGFIEHSKVVDPEVLKACCDAMGVTVEFLESDSWTMPEGGA